MIQAEVIPLNARTEPIHLLWWFCKNYLSGEKTPRFWTFILHKDFHMVPLPLLVSSYGSFCGSLELTDTLFAHSCLYSMLLTVTPPFIRCIPESVKSFCLLTAPLSFSMVKKILFTIIFVEFQGEGDKYVWQPAFLNQNCPSTNLIVIYQQVVLTTHYV